MYACLLACLQMILSSFHCLAHLPFANTHWSDWTKRVSYTEWLKHEGSSIHTVINLQHHEFIGPITFVIGSVIKLHNNDECFNSFFSAVSLFVITAASSAHFVLSFFHYFLKVFLADFHSRTKFTYLESRYHEYLVIKIWYKNCCAIRGNIYWLIMVQHNMRLIHPYKDAEMATFVCLFFELPAGVNMVSHRVWSMAILLSIATFSSHKTLLHKLFSLISSYLYPVVPLLLI